MAFKSVSPGGKSYNDIESLFRDLNTSRVQSLYSHQADIIRHYQEQALDKANVAIELPTGSGKTLVGLLIAEFKRRKSNQKILYLCPTKQLVHQVVELANDSYGLKCIAFAGSNRNYSEQDKYAYDNGDAVAVTTYSSLFNTNPWFVEPDLVILDDAHTAENYVSSCWSVSISRYDNEELYRALIDTINEDIPYSVRLRLENDDVDYFDRNIIEKYSNIKLFERKEELHSILSTYLDDDQKLKYPWRMIKDHLEACQLFYSWGNILIRPFIPPSLENTPFKQAKQRIFMSATLGKGGDLERITGIKSFYKIPIPTGWDKQGMGRRLFMFPSLSLQQDEVSELMDQLIDQTERTVVLVSSDETVNNWRLELQEKKPDVEFFSAYDIEESKEDFIESKKAAIVLANRFDGIDFSGDQSRLLFLIDIPYASNLQEKFLQSRMNASIIFYDRNKTRLIQAIGRCTRSPKDFSAICVLGDKDLSEWLLLKNKNKFLHPELQAELEFGIANSMDSSISGFVENFNLFIDQANDWEKANDEIIQLRHSKKQDEIEGTLELETSARDEVRFQYKLWNKQYQDSYEIANDILAKLNGGSNLAGYRAFWNYQAASVAHILFHKTNDELYKKNRDKLLQRLINICPSASWARNISDITKSESALDDLLINNIERLQLFLSWKKVNNQTQYNNYLKQIEEFILTNKLESLNLEIGKLLGFDCDNPSSDAAPDPYWISGSKYVIVFEDKFYKNVDGAIKIDDIRQAGTHKDWIKKHLKKIESDAEIVTVMVTNRTECNKEGITYAEGIKYWSYDKFVQFSRDVISMARNYSKYYAGENDSNWKNFFVDEFDKKGFSPRKIIANLPNLTDI